MRREASSTSASSTAPARRCRSTPSSTRRGCSAISAPRACCSTTRPAACCRTSRRSSSSGSPKRAGSRSGSTSRPPEALRSRTRSSPRASARTSWRPPSIRSRSRSTGSRGVARRGARGLGRPTGVDVARLWEASDVVDEHIGDEPLAPLAPRIAVRAAEYDLPAGLVAALDVHLRAHAAGDRLLDTLAEVVRIREEAGSPPLAAPIGQILGSQALLNVLSARRYGTVLDEFRQLVTGGYGTPPSAIEPTVRRAVELLGGDRPALEDDPPSAEDVRGGRRAGLLRGGPRPARDVRRGGRDAPADDPPASLPRGVAPRRRRRRAARRADPRARPDRAGVGCRRDRDRGRGHARVGSPRGRAGHAAVARRGRCRLAAPEGVAEGDGTGESIRVESPMVGIFYRAPQPEPRRSSRSVTSSRPGRPSACSRR